MQEHRPDLPDDILVDHPTNKRIREALNDPRVPAVTLWKPGQIVELRSGSRYEVQADGSWKRLE